MKKQVLYLLSLALLAACSAPKYTYHFDHYNYNATQKGSADVATEQLAQGPVAIQPQELTASAEPMMIVETEKSVSVAPAVAKKTYVQMSKTERKEVRKMVKAEIKKYVKSKRDSDKSVQGTKAMDKDLKLAAIFGAVGLVLTLFAGVSSAFWVIGVIAFVIGVVFLIKWLAKQ